MKNILWFKEVNKSNIAEVGGKGASLGEIDQKAYKFGNNNNIINLRIVSMIPGDLKWLPDAYNYSINFRSFL